MTFAMSLDEMQELQARFNKLRLEDELLQSENKSLRTTVDELRDALDRISKGTPVTVHEEAMIGLAKKVLAKSS